MIPYEELCAALDRYRANHEGEVVEMTTSPSALDPVTHEHAMPPVGDVGVQPIYDDRSNELDIGDVLSDEEAPKN